LVILLFVSRIYLYSQPNCKLKKDQDSIKVYTCHTDTFRFKSIIAEFTINTTLDQLAGIALDIPNYTKWQYNTVESNVVTRISEYDQIYHTVIKAPWPVTDRDMVVNIKVKYDNDNQGMTITTESKKGILPAKVGFVRVPSSRGLWIVKQINKNRLHVKYTMQIDPGGSVPTWLVDWVCAQAPYQSFKSLKTIFEGK